MKKLNAALFLLGVAFLLYLVYRVGPGDLWQQLRHLSWGIVPLVLSEGLANLAHTLGWRRCLGQASGRVSILRLFRIAMAGFALNYLTPSASLGGEVTKASLLAAHHPGPQAVSSVLVDKLSLAVAHLLLVMLGAVLLLACINLPPVLWAAMLVSSCLLAGGMVAFLLIQKHGKLGGLLRWLAGQRFVGRAFDGVAQNFSKVDQALVAFYRERPLDLVLSVLWHLLGHAMAIFQTWLFLYLMHQPASLLAAACAAFLGLWFDLLSFAVPLNLGALEGGRIVALKAVGADALLGVAFGFALRLAQLFWAAFGLANYALLLKSYAPAGPKRSSNFWRRNWKMCSTSRRTKSLSRSLPPGTA